MYVFIYRSVCRSCAAIELITGIPNGITLPPFSCNVALAVTVQREQSLKVFFGYPWIIKKKPAEQTGELQKCVLFCETLGAIVWVSKAGLAHMLHNQPVL